MNMKVQSFANGVMVVNGLSMSEDAYKKLLADRAAKAEEDKAKADAAKTAQQDTATTAPAAKTAAKAAAPAAATKTEADKA